MNLPLHSPAEIVAVQPEEPPAVVRGLVVLGAITEVAAYLKVGKTRFILEMIRATLANRPFLGCPTQRAVWLLLTEEWQPTLAEAFRRASLEAVGPEDMLVVMRRELPRALPWPELVRAGTAEAVQRAAGRPVVLVADTLSRVAGMPADAEKDAGAAAAVMEPLTQAARSGLAVVTGRHDRKGGGEVGESARGSSAFGGEADILLQLRRIREDGEPTNIRELAALSRFISTPGQAEPIRCRLDPGGYTVLGTLGDTQAAKAQRLELAVLGFVEDHPGAALRDARDGVKGKNGDIDTAIRVLLEEGRLVHRAVGRKRADGRTYTAQGLFASRAPAPGAHQGTGGRASSTSDGRGVPPHPPVRGAEHDTTDVEPPVPHNGGIGHIDDGDYLSLAESYPADLVEAQP